MRQLLLPMGNTDQDAPAQSHRAELIELLSQDLDFHDQDSSYASHNFHSFPAKFPPQLPRKFITALTKPGDLVFDPMMGSGTTILEAILAGRRGFGLDIDPLALKIAQVKIRPLGVEHISRLVKSLLSDAREDVKVKRSTFEEKLQLCWGQET